MTFLTKLPPIQYCAKLNLVSDRMPSSDSAISLESFQTFGELLKYLRRRARLTQRELSIAVGYSEAQISRLEQSQRPPDLAALTALFIPALYLEDEPLIVSRLLELAAQARGEKLPQSGTVTFSHSVQREVRESVRTEEESVLNNLPLQLTSFIGREHEITEIKKLLGKARLVTLSGSGGCGKTRLSLEVARQLTESYQDGIWLIELASILDPALVIQAVTSTLHIRESRDGTLMEALTKHLRAKHILLIFDNCEQIISAAAQLAEDILHTCPHVQVLATSREILNIPGEVRFRVPSLSLPQDESLSGDIVSQFESVRLFVERAQAAFPSFTLNKDNASAVAQICRRLDGIPLAIELASARMTALSIQQIAGRLENSFQLLTGGSITLPRHQTLQATIEWSYELLSEAERVLLDRLSVFSGGWTLEAAESIVNDPSLVPTDKLLDLLSQLVNKSLVIMEWQSRTKTRYTILQTIYDFAREKLRVRGELESIRARHFDYFFTLVQQGESNLFVNESWLALIEAEIDNLRAALTWALEAGTVGPPSPIERTERGLELMAHVWPLWLYRGYLTEGNEWMSQLLAAHTASTPARARALLLAADFARYRGDYASQVDFVQESLTLARKLGDKKRIAWALMETGLLESDVRHYPQAILLLEEAQAMFQELNEILWVYRIYYLMAEVQIADGKLEIARSLWSQGLDLCRAENDKWHIGWGLEGLGNVERLEGHLEQAREFYTESLHLRVNVMDKAGITNLLEAFAQLAAAQKQFERAAVLWGAAEQMLQTLNALRPIPAKDILYTSWRATMRAEMGEELFTTAWAEGRAMTMQEAIDYALTLPDN